MDNSGYFWQGRLVRLRGYRPSDAEDVYLDRLDSACRQVLQLGIETPKTLEGVQEALARHLDCRDADGVILFAIESLAGEMVGGISLHSRDVKNGTFGFGIYVRKAHRGRGYAEDAARLLLKYAFHEQRFEKCNSSCIHTNAASMRMHEKLGFVPEGRRRRVFFLNGQFYDDVLYGLTREEFDDLAASQEAGSPPTPLSKRS